METPLYSFCEGSIANAVWDELDGVPKEYPSLQSLRDDITRYRHAKIPNRNGDRTPTFQKCSDAQIRDEGEPFPPFAVEIGYGDGQPC